ncbi:hypothetical protein D3C73_1339130 [compost metagenome]
MIIDLHKDLGIRSDRIAFQSVVLIYDIIAVRRTVDAGIRFHFGEHVLGFLPGVPFYRINREHTAVRPKFQLIDIDR